MAAICFAAILHFLMRAKHSQVFSRCFGLPRRNDKDMYNIFSFDCSSVPNIEMTEAGSWPLPLSDFWYVPRVCVTHNILT